ncbi:hypothetical protein Tco_1471360, partial [Tanacetum coccineum]
ESLRSSMESSIVPTFETSCKAMFGQLDATFQKGLLEHTSTTQQHVESTHSPCKLCFKTKERLLVQKICDAEEAMLKKWALSFFYRVLNYSIDSKLWSILGIDNGKVITSEEKPRF